MSKHRLYYSTRCRFCQAFMEELVKTPFVPEFQLMCVDPSPSRPPLPPWLKSVPSMVVLGETSPRVGPGPVNNWLSERKIGAGSVKSSMQAMEERSKPLTLPVYSPEIAPRPNATSRTTVSSPPTGSGSSGTATSSATSSGSSATSATSDAGPEAYHDTEMGGTKWSDNYSFLGGTEFVSDKGYDPIARNFESLLPASVSMFGGGAPMTSAASAPKRSAKEEQLISEFEKFAASRDRDVPGPVARK